MPAVIVEQLNASQWHANRPSGPGSGVVNWVEAVSIGLIYGAIDGLPVESLDLDHNRLLLAHAEPAENGGSQ